MINEKENNEETNTEGKNIEVTNNEKISAEVSFETLLKEKKLQYTGKNITIQSVPNAVIVAKYKKSVGYALPLYTNNRLSGVELLIANDNNISEIDKIKSLSHEEGHAIDYINRKTELEQCKSNFALSKKFNEESEFFAFENSLKEGLKLAKKNRVDVLESLMTTIPTRSKDIGYEYGVKKIMDTDLWTECKYFLKSIKENFKNNDQKSSTP